MTQSTGRTRSTPSSTPSSTATPSTSSHAPADHWFGGASGGRVVIGGLVGSAGLSAGVFTASLLLAVAAALLVLVAAVAVAMLL